jgi:hypothetical protein
MPRAPQRRYVTPVYFLGARVTCKVRGVVEIVGLSSGPHPWPVGRQDWKQELIVYKGLAKAVREESPEFVAARWGVPVETVVEWKSHLDKPPVVESPKPIKRRRRIGRPPHTHVWTPEEDEIIRTTATGKAQKLLGVSAPTIIKRRRLLGVGLHDLLRRG